MRLAIMQPYFLPYLGYLSLVKHADRFVLLDEVQFIRHGWIERNRILKPTVGWQYVQVPLERHSRETKIKDVEIRNQETWREKIIAQLQHYKRLAPFFPRVIALLQDAFSRQFERIVDLDRVMLEAVCGYLRIQTPIAVFSEMGLAIGAVNAPDEWALAICRAMGATEYWNPPGGMGFFDRSKYEASHVDLRFQKIRLAKYDQKRPSFEPGLSIIDVMMFNSVDRINEMLDDYELL